MISPCRIMICNDTICDTCECGDMHAILQGSVRYHVIPRLPRLLLRLRPRRRLRRLRRIPRRLRPRPLLWLWRLRVWRVALGARLRCAIELHPLRHLVVFFEAVQVESDGATGAARAVDTTSSRDPLDLAAAVGQRRRRAALEAPLARPKHLTVEVARMRPWGEGSFLPLRIQVSVRPTVHHLWNIKYVYLAYHVRIMCVSHAYRVRIA